MYSRFERFDVESLGTISAPASANNVDLRKLAALGGQKRAGQILKVARLLMFFDTELDVNATTASGIIDGKRTYEIVDRVQLRPRGWPVEHSHDLDARNLRLWSIWQRGRLPHRDPLNYPDTTATDIARRIVIEIPFWRPRTPRPEDECPAALMVGEGSLQFSAAALNVGGVDNEQLLNGRVVAECFYGDPEIPVFTRLRQRRIGTTDQRFDLMVDADRISAAWLCVGDYSQAAATDNLEGTFDEARTVQFVIDGRRMIEDLTVEELVEIWNADTLTQTLERATGSTAENEGCAEDPELPTFVPLLNAFADKKTKLPRARGESYVEFSGQLQDAATGTTRSVDLVTHEVFGVAKGSRAATEYLKAGRANAHVMVRRKTESKAAEVSDDKAAVVPLKILRPSAPARRA